MCGNTLFDNFQKNLVDNKKYLIVVTLQKSFRKRFDHFNQSENIFQSYSHRQKNIFKIDILKLEISFGIYVIFMEFFDLTKSLKCVVQCIRNVPLHRMNGFWWVRNHVSKNSSIFLMLELSYFTKSDIFTMCLNDSMEEFFVRTHTWKLFQWIIWIM